VIEIKDEAMECTSENINSSNSEVNPTNSEKTLILLDKLKLVQSSQNTAVDSSA
jgi:hypothetical protein